MKNLKLTLKAWPVIALATIGLCYLTQLVAGWFGVNLPEQKNVDIIRNMFLHAFDSWTYFRTTALNTALILIILPVIEELIFRGPTRWLRHWLWWASFAALFSAAHYLAQPWPDNAFAALFFFGLAQCWLYRKTDHLWCAILNHGLFNLTNLVLLLIIPTS